MVDFFFYPIVPYQHSDKSSRKKLFKYLSMCCICLNLIIENIYYDTGLFRSANIAFLYSSDYILSGSNTLYLSPGNPVHSLYLLNESFTNGLNYNVLTALSLLSVVCGVFVIISKNPIVSVLFLIGLFLSIAGYLMLLGLNFIGLSYLLVYVGAVSILFLFILMLINVRISELVTDNNNSVPLGLMIGIIFYHTFNKLIPSYYIVELKTYLGKGGTKSNNIEDTLGYLFESNNNELSFITRQIWDGALAETSHITSIGNIIYTGYPLLLILTSIILLLAMVGAIVITIKK